MKFKHEPFVPLVAFHAIVALSCLYSRRQVQQARTVLALGPILTPGPHTGTKQRWGIPPLSPLLPHSQGTRNVTCASCQLSNESFRVCFYCCFLYVFLSL